MYHEAFDFPKRRQPLCSSPPASFSFQPSAASIHVEPQLMRNASDKLILNPPQLLNHYEVQASAGHNISLAGHALPQSQAQSQANNVHSEVL